MEQLIPLLTNLATGAVGGNVAGAALKDKSLGFSGNTISGLVGALLGSTVGASQLAVIASALGLPGMSGDLATSGASGAIAMAIFTYAKPYIMPYIASYLPGMGASTQTIQQG
jgi:uncharacterized membrane protein YeaQ/YmgE (transglycosylase-associated protein family)